MAASLTKRGKKINQDIKKLWVDALRSGEYKQGKGRLMYTNFICGGLAYCCYGVLCELHSQITKHGDWHGVPEMYHVTGEWADFFPPTEVLLWAGLRLDCKDIVIIDRHERTLQEHNDSGKTFAQLADAIEANL